MDPVASPVMQQPLVQQPRVMMVQVPSGAEPGQVMRVQAPTGTLVEVRLFFAAIILCLSCHYR